MMTQGKNPESLRKRAGYNFGYCIGFLLIFAIGLVVLWITMVPYH